MMKKWAPNIIISAMLLWALYPENPYGYYILLRFACCGFFGWLAFRSYSSEQKTWMWIFGVTALIYNPFIRTHLNREIWSVLNIVTIVLAWLSNAVLKKPN